MPLVSAKCTNCGAALQVDSAKEAAICPYCKSAYVVEDAINNYNITNNVTNNISGSVVNIYAGDTKDFVIRAGNLEKYNGASTEVIIPSSVTSIGYRAFYECCGLTKIIIPSSVTIIGKEAFYRCSGLKEITIPESVTHIGESAFEGCSNLSEITIPESVVQIDRRAFALGRNSKDERSCKILNISSIDAWFQIQFADIFSIPLNDNAYINGKAITELIIPSEIEYIDYRFSRFKGVKRIIIQNGVVAIGDSAFSGCCNLFEVTIPESVVKIGKEAFTSCNRLNISSLKAWNRIKFADPSSVPHNDNVYIKGKVITELIIPNGVESISYCFCGFRGLKKIDIPKSLIYIGENAFCGCCGLEEVSIPNNVTYINKSAFAGCTNLKEITIPGSVKTISSKTFSGCTGLHKVNISNGVQFIGTYAFSGCTGLREITIPYSVLEIGKSAFKNCTELTEITIKYFGTKLNNQGDEYILDPDFSDPNPCEPFEKSIIQNVNAPREWKKRYYYDFDCLIDYNPQKSGCYIATAVYGSYDAPEVMVLRRFRDEELQRTLLGRAFIRTYYFLSPPVANWLKNAEKTNNVVRKILDKWVRKLKDKYK